LLRLFFALSLSVTFSFSLHFSPVMTIPFSILPRFLSSFRLDYPIENISQEGKNDLDTSWGQNLQMRGMREREERKKDEGEGKRTTRSIFDQHC
jgi:hypothetical protein